MILSVVKMNMGVERFGCKCVFENVPCLMGSIPRAHSVFCTELTASILVYLRFSGQLPILLTVCIRAHGS